MKLTAKVLIIRPKRLSGIQINEIEATNLFPCYRLEANPERKDLYQLKKRCYRSLPRFDLLRLLATIMHRAKASVKEEIRYVEPCPSLFIRREADYLNKNKQTGTSHRDSYHLNRTPIISKARDPRKDAGLAITLTKENLIS